MNKIWIQFPNKILIKWYVSQNIKNKNNKKKIMKKYKKKNVIFLFLILNLIKKKINYKSHIWMALFQEKLHLINKANKLLKK